MIWRSGFFDPNENVKFILHTLIQSEKKKLVTPVPKTKRHSNTAAVVLTAACCFCSCCEKLVQYSS